jgi:hypothetical protein
MPADLRRQRIGTMFISIDSVEFQSNEIECATQSAAAASTTRADCRGLVHGRQMSGGKGAKGGNLESAGKTGLADGVATRRKLAETLFCDPIAVRKYSWLLGLAAGRPLVRSALTRPRHGWDTPNAASCRRRA